MTARSSSSKPLIVDADGTLLATDMFFECFWSALGKQPIKTVTTLFTCLNNIPRLKQKMAKIADLDIASLPKHNDVLAYCRDAKLAGRSVIIASGSDRALVEKLSISVDFGDDYLASDGVSNLTSTRKADALVARYGLRGFDYIGDSKSDIAVWKASDKAIAVAPSSRVLAKVGRTVQVLGSPTKIQDVLRAFRPHQWVKNLLLFLPLFAAHRSDSAGLLLVLWGVVAFSAAASSIYIVNDLVDLSADRQHETKRLRPFASGAVPIQTGMLASVGLGVFALSASAFHSWQLAAVVTVYMTLSLSYSLVLKRLRWVDVSTLAALYTLRVVAGSVAAGVGMSGWLGSFIFPIFLALGCVKRLVELSKAKNENTLPGRGYARRDRGDLLNIGITAGVASIIVFGLYSFSDMALQLYAAPWELRLAGVAVGFWLARMISRGWHGKMDYDPIVFALRDPVGLAMIAAGGGLLLHAAA